MSRRPPSDRRFDAQAILQIRAAETSNAAEAKLRNCSKEFIRQIRAGLMYRDLWDPAFAVGTVTCLRCVHWGDGGCTLGHQDPIEEGPEFARECAAWVEGKS
jgi:hypothetical protein